MIEDVAFLLVVAERAGDGHPLAVTAATLEYIDTGPLAPRLPPHPDCSLSNSPVSVTEHDRHFKPDQALSKTKSFASPRGR